MLDWKPRYLSRLGLKSQVQLAANREQRQLFHRRQYNAARVSGHC
jgi:hypothetical protein